MQTQKVAITIPSDLLALIDATSNREKISRSRLISRLLAEKVAEQQARFLKQAYDGVFADPQIQREQIETAAAFEALGNEAGQQW
jgi:metal-responsive CopG/Arc/MetJ family transcriptional regulator